ncbi:MAG: hypothetical protein Q8L55_04350 [Phycisphaerales bacterium]|nr:hypothetical protein [Phycisphaerales bacterium]
MNSKLLSVSLMAIVLAAGSTAVCADDKNQPPLRGPRVPERQVPGVDNGLGTMDGGFDKKGVAREMPIPHREFMRMLNEALGASAPDNIRLSDDQQAAVEKAGRDFAEKQRAFGETNRGEIEKLVAKYGPEVRQLTQRLMAARGGMPGGPAGADAKRPGRDGAKPGEKPSDRPSDRPAGGPDPMRGDAPAGSGLTDEARAEVIAKLKELQASAPKPEDARTAVWGTLRPEQQAAVQVKVDAFKAEREKQMDEKYKEREKKKLEERGTKKDPAAPGAEPGKGRPGADAPAKPLDAAQRAELVGQLPDDLKAAFEKLPEQAQGRMLGRLATLKPEQREEFFAAMRERMKGGEGAAPRRPGKN